MKARVKGTNNIIDVEFDKDAFNEGYPPYWEKQNNMFYQPEQLEWIDIKEKAEPDYWTRLEHQYAGMAMQGIMTNPNGFENLRAGVWKLQIETALLASEFAHALVEKLKEKEERK